MDYYTIRDQIKEIEEIICYNFHNIPIEIKEKLFEQFEDILVQLEKYGD